MRKRPADEVNDGIDLLIAGGLDVEPFWLIHARRAAILRAEHYHRETAPISLSDAACIATAGILRTDLATSDPALARVAGRVGVPVIPLLDSNGHLP